MLQHAKVRGRRLDYNGGCKIQGCEPVENKIKKLELKAKGKQRETNLIREETASITRREKKQRKYTRIMPAHSYFSLSYFSYFYYPYHLAVLFLEL